IATEPAGTFRALDGDGTRVTASLSSSITTFSAQGDVVRQITGYGWANTNPAGTLTTGQDLWIGDASAGLISTQDYTRFTNYSLPCPYTDNVADIVFSDNNFYVTGGTVDNAWGNVYRPLQVFTGSDDSWKSNILYGEADRDAMRVIADPDNEKHFFVSSWGNGLYEFLDGELIKNYNQYNSPLASIRPGENYSRICGLAWDRSGNLWMTQTGVAGNLKALTPDGNWITTPVNLSVTAVGD